MTDSIMRIDLPCTTPAIAHRIVCCIAVSWRVLIGAGADGTVGAVLASTNQTEVNLLTNAMVGAIGVSPSIDTTLAAYQSFVALWQAQVLLMERVREGRQNECQ